MYADFSNDPTFRNIAPSDFKLALPDHMEALNVMADALRLKAAQFAGNIIGDLAVSGNVHEATFTTTLPAYPRHAISLVNNAPLRGARGITAESHNVTLSTHRMYSRVRSRGTGVVEGLCDSYTHPLVADKNAQGHHSRLRGAFSKDNTIENPYLVYERPLAPLSVGAAARLLVVLRAIDQEIMEKAS